MFSAIYCEQGLKQHPRVLSLKKRFSSLPFITCDKYNEVFNLKKQNFRLQKIKPALILAKKSAPFLFSIPSSYGIGHKHNKYFSHMYNCIYDCRYCYLQGQYSSAHYVLFINYEDYQQAIEEDYNKLDLSEECCYFSGYECDSMALESLSHFTQYFVPFFANYPRAYLELRTKSTHIQPLLKFKPTPNIIIAYSLNPSSVIKSIENKTPNLSQRLKALATLQSRGWQIALRFDPLLLISNYKATYQAFFEEVNKSLDLEKVHSITIGSLRFPKKVGKKIESYYPKDPLFASLNIFDTRTISYPPDIEKQMQEHCLKYFSRYTPKQRIFQCQIAPA